jgi:predicted Fe-Mo cluster-binding NifX family protein
MKIAIPSNDKQTISAHFGRTEGFVILTIEDGEVQKSEYFINNFTGHSQGLQHEHEHSNDNGHVQQSHQGIFKAIGDCQVVIAGGMGRRLYTDFEQRKIKVFVTRERSIEKAVQLFIAENLDNDSEKCCDH